MEERLVKEELPPSFESSAVSASSFSSLSSLRAKYLQACCRPSFSFRSFKSRGAALILVWNYLAFSIYYYLGGINGECFLLNKIPFLGKHSVVIIAIMTLFYPLAGWLADVQLSRYKVVIGGLRLMWLGMLFSTAGLLLKGLNSTTEVVFGYAILPLLYIVTAVGLACFQANIIQFGIDQLLDASSREIKSFVNWFVWTIYGCVLVISFFLDCVRDSMHMEVTKPLYLTVALSLALCSDFFFGHWLVREPTGVNPFKLIGNILNYALRNKIPRQRSAFTYWEDTKPSRIDLAKQKYGGPYTTEQVEDVKTFLRILIMFLSICAFAGANITTVLVQTELVNHLHGYDTDYLSLSQCFQKRAILHLDHYGVVLFIPFYEFVILPLFGKCIPQTTIFIKFGIGMALLLLNIAMQCAVDVTGHQNTNGTVPCLLSANSSSPTLNISYQWMAIPELINGLSAALLLNASIQFICAQSPYSMKGVLIGVLYAILGLFALLSFLILLPFVLAFRKGNGGLISCEFWYYLMDAAVVSVSITVFLVMARLYKNRERDETVSDHMFAENYYSNLTVHPASNSVSMSSQSVCSRAPSINYTELHTSNFVYD